MAYKLTIKKIKKRLWALIVKRLNYKTLHFLLYRSYWNLILKGTTKQTENTCKYFSATPNEGAGIGHQLANWIAGYWFAKQFELKFAHTPFSTKEWEEFLGLGETEVHVDNLIKIERYKKIRLPMFDELKLNEVLLIKEIINSYRNKKIVFIAEQDQGYRDQFGIKNEIKLKFHNAIFRKKDVIMYEKNKYNIAVHVRRGDIFAEKHIRNPNLLMRWQDNTYYENVLDNVLTHLKTDKDIAIYFFSQGRINDFESFKKYKNLTFCLNMDTQQSFLHMAKSDLLITSKSSFSYKPALLNNGIKICPKVFWHGYPDESDWILAEENGNFDINNLKINL